MRVEKSRTVQYNCFLQYVQPSSIATRGFVGSPTRTSAPAAAVWAADVSSQNPRKPRATHFICLCVDKEKEQATPCEVFDVRSRSTAGRMPNRGPAVLEAGAVAEDVATTKREKIF